MLFNDSSVGNHSSISGLRLDQKLVSNCISVSIGCRTRSRAVSWYISRDRHSGRFSCVGRLHSMITFSLRQEMLTFKVCFNQASIAFVITRIFENWFSLTLSQRNLRDILSSVLTRAVSPLKLAHVQKHFALHLFHFLQCRR
jgi:hypothetical protein